MVYIPDYQQVSFTGLQKKLHQQWVDTGSKPHLKIASFIKVESTNTIKNSFKTDKQWVSDAVLTGIMNFLELDGFIIWVNGKRQYYISNKK